MAWFRRRRSSSESTSTEVALTETRAVAIRTEKALVALAVHARDMSDRLGRLEERVEEQLETLTTHDEMLEVRLHSAKVAAEVSRLAVNLRAQIDDVKTRLPSEGDARVTTLAQTIIDLSDGLDTTSADLRSVTDDDTWATTA